MRAMLMSHFIHQEAEAQNGEVLHQDSDTGCHQSLGSDWYPNR